MNSVVGLTVSFLYIGLVLLTGTIISKVLKNPNEFSKKWIHILSGNWVFIAFYFFKNPWMMGIVPFSFIIINYLSFKFKLVPAMERDDNSFGTVWYAVTLLFATVIALIAKQPQLAYIGILIMAYGDGLAAIFEKKWGKPFSLLFKQKSFVGSFCVFIVAFVITLGVQFIFNSEWNFLIALVVAFISTFVEMASSEGCDNLTLPLASTLIYYFMNLNITYFLVIIFITFLIVFMALYLNALTTDGGVAALLIEISLYALGGIYLWSTLVAFFILGSLQSKFKNKRKQVAKTFEKGEKKRN